MDALTILDMLDRLEAEIVLLRSRNKELETVAHSGTGVSPRGSRKKKRARNKPVTKTAKTTRTRTPKPVPPPTQEGPLDNTKPAIGKRQALGRSIIQLRRLSAASRTEN